MPEPQKDTAQAPAPDSASATAVLEKKETVAAPSDTAKPSGDAVGDAHAGLEQGRKVRPEDEKKDNKPTDKPAAEAPAPKPAPVEIKKDNGNSKELLQNAIIAGNIPDIVLHMITYATNINASDIHIEPLEKIVRIRF